MTLLATMPKPVVAALNGTAAGAGLGLACACDLRVGAAGSRYTTAFAGIGLTADSGLSWTLPRLVGGGRATALLLARELGAQGLSVTRIASGIPHGGELEFADQVTLGRAIDGRRSMG